MNIVYNYLNGKPLAQQTPADYGCKDWYHNPDGSVSYPCVIDAETGKPESLKGTSDRTDFSAVSIEEQRYPENDLEHTQEPLSYERNRYAELCNSFREQERIEEEFN